MKIKKAILSKFIICLSVVLCGFYIFYTQDNRKEMKMIKNNIEIYWDEILNTATIWEEDTALPKRDVQKLLDMSYSRNQGTDKDIPRIDYLHMIKVNHYEIKNIEKLTDGLYRAFINVDSPNYGEERTAYISLINQKWYIIFGVQNISEEYKKRVEQEKGIVLEKSIPNDGTIVLN